MKKILILIFSLLISLTIFVNITAENGQKVVDEVDYLSESEEQQLTNIINSFINKTNYDMVVYLTDEIGDYFDNYNEDEAITRLADDYYDHNGYGMGNDNDGLIMCIVFAESTLGYNTYTITTCGSSCINTYTDYALNEMYRYISEYLADGDLVSGIEEFVEDAQYIYDNYDSYHSSNTPDSYNYTKSNPFVDALAPAFIGGLIVALVTFLILRGQLKNTGVKYTANNYMNNQHINISRSGELYLYTTRTVHKVEKPDPPSSHSSSHTSSSGVSHGGGGSHRF